MAAALEYSNALFSGALAYWLLSTLTSVVRGTGHAAVLAVVYVAAEALHIVLVPALMFGIGPLPALGIAGAGIATVTSFSASSAALAWFLASGRTAIALSWRDVRLSRRLFVDILRVGAPMSLQPILTNLALVVLTGFVGTLGAAHLAGFGIAARLEYLLYPLAFGLGAGVIAIVGTSLGAGNVARAARAAWTAAALAAVVTGCIGLLGLAAAARVGEPVHRQRRSARPDRRVSGGGRTRLSAAGCRADGGFGIPGGGSTVLAAGWYRKPRDDRHPRRMDCGPHRRCRDPTGLALAAAAGLIVYGAIQIIAFRRWQIRAAAEKARCEA